MKDYEYEIYYRLGDSEWLETESHKVKADSIEELFETIKSIEKRHTIVHIKNLDVL